jgi:hypothetical protein
MEQQKKFMEHQKQLMELVKAVMESMNNGNGNGSNQFSCENLRD